MIEETKELGKEIINDTKEVVIERFFSPMYFYFILAWIIYNWTFIYSLLFVNSQKIKKFKLDYLLSFYPTNSFWDYLCNFWYVLLGPALSTYIIIWWFSKLSEKSYGKFEEYKSNKRSIKRLLDYQEKVKIATEERKIREQESDKPKIRYNDNDDFNNSLDEIYGDVEISGIKYTSSDLLYNTDYEAYVEQLNEFNTNKKEI